MEFDLTSVLLIGLVVLVMCLFMKIKKGFCMDNLLLIFTILCPICFSALGIIFKDYNNTDYLIPFILYIVALFITVLLGTRLKSKGKGGRFLGSIAQTLEDNQKIFNFLGYVALFLQLTILIYPTFKIIDLLFPFKMSYSFSVGTYFTSRLFARTDALSQILSIFRTAFLPFFFILLYNHRDNPKFVIFTYVFYYYISYINEYYIQRNKIVIILIFILMYLFYENKISKKAFKKILLISIPLILGIIGFLGSYRTLNSTDISIGDSIIAVIEQEASTQRHLTLCNTLSSLISFPKMVLSIVTAPLFFLPDVNFPTLAYLFTEALTGMAYADMNYYVLLPCSFGEAVMIFGKNLAFVYGIFLGGCVSFVYNFLKKMPHTKYFLLFIVLNYAACFRGSVQSFLLQTINLLFSFFVVTLCVGFVSRNKKV